LFGGNNFVVVSALRHPSIAVGGVLQARNEGDIPLPNPAFAVSPPESPTWDKPGYASFGYWGTFVLPAHDSRITGIVLKPGEYILDLTASNGPAYETLTIPSSNDASKQHVKITKNGVVVYDKDINF
jgi:hypothetical protein